MTDFEWVAAAIVAALSAARITRLFVFDSWPPTARLRAWWEGKVSAEWEPLLKCGYCFGVYSAAAVLGSAWAIVALTGSLHWGWWLFNGWMALSYTASIIVAFDGDD
jgi:hypothetical protein